MIKTDFKPNCLLSKNITPQLLQGTQTFPETLDLRDLTLATEDQGSTSMCAAYTATSWAETINWRKSSQPINLDPVSVYNYAKTIDGYPRVDGTTLDAVLYSLLHFKMISGNSNQVFCFRSLNDLKKVIHKYGPCLVAFNVSDCWMTHYGKLVLSGEPGRTQGGHAVLCCGYTKAGLIIQNSWGIKWGKWGYGVISWDLVNLQFQYGAILRNCLDNLN